jgi:hypothetical protein
MGAVVDTVLEVAAVAAVAVFAPEILPALGEIAPEIGATIVDGAGEVVASDLATSTVVMDTVATDPIIVATADAAPETLTTMADAATTTSTTTAATTTADVGLTVPETTTAVEQGTSTLAATGDNVAVASTQQATASTVIESGGTVEQATDAVQIVNQGGTVTEATTAATDGAVTPNAVTEVANTGTNSFAQGFQDLSQSANEFMKGLGDTILPGQDPMVQKFVAQTAVNSATNGGDFEKALTNSVIGLGTGSLGGEIASETGSQLAGQVGANAARQLVTTGDINAEGLATGAAGSLIGNEVAGDTGSQLAGKAASTVTSSLLSGKDPSTALLNLGASTLINGAVNDVKDFTSSLGKTDDTQGNTDTNQKTDAITGLPTSVSDLSNTETSTPDTGLTPRGGLSTASNADNINETDLSKTGIAGTNISNLDTSTDIGAIDRAAQNTDNAVAQNTGEEPAAPSGLSAANVQTQTSLNGEQPKPEDATSSLLPKNINALSPLGIAGAAGSALATNAIKGAISGNTAKPISGLNAVKPTAQAPASRLSLDQLQQLMTPNTQSATPVARVAPKPTPFVPPKKVDVSTLTPINSISGLMALLTQKKNG